MSTDDTLLRTVLIVLAVIVLLPLLLMLVTMPMMGAWGGGHMWNGAWNGTGWSWLWLVPWGIVLLFVVGIGYLLYAALRGSTSREEDAALEELRIAYARGDLSEEEYEKRRDRLERER